jgi:Uma2 family endonuclease
MTTTRQRLTLEEFLALPETEPASEFMCGEVYRKPMPDNAHAALQAYLWMLLSQFVAARKLGRVRIEWRCIFGPRMAQRAFVPDVVYVSYSRLPPGDARTLRYPRTAPDVAIEVSSPDHHGSRLAAKVQFYLRHGVRLVWVVDPNTEEIYVYSPDQDDAIVLRPGDTLTGGDVLPGFEAAVADIFAQLQN